MKLSVILCFLLISLTIQGAEDSLASANDYANIAGTQVYLYEKSNAFSYMTIDSTSTDKLKAKVYLYVNVNLADLSAGVYTAFGLGTKKMLGSDMVVCAATKDSTMWCKDFEGASTFSSPSATKKTTLVSSSAKALSSAWAPYKTVITWDIERTTSPSKLLDGTELIISAFGSLSDATTVSVHSFYNYPTYSELNKPLTTTSSTSTTTTTATSTTSTSSSNLNILKYSSLMILGLMFLLIN